MSEPGGTLPPFTTPALIVDLDVFEANVAAMEQLLRGTGKTVRPHAKTHRTPELARRQLGGSAVGVTCATVGEAEVMVAAGIDDVFVANEVVEPAKIARLVALAHRARIGVAADDPEPVEQLAHAAVEQGVTVGRPARHRHRAPPLRAGLRRGGRGAGGRDRAAPGGPARRDHGLRGPHPPQRRGPRHEDRRGVRDPGRGAGRRSSRRASRLTSCRRPARRRSAEALADPTITELQSGVYALMEPELLVMDLPFRCAVTVRGTVISRHPGRAVLDVGRRVVGLENGPPVPAGFIAEPGGGQRRAHDPRPRRPRARPRQQPGPGAGPDPDHLQPARLDLGEPGRPDHRPLARHGARSLVVRPRIMAPSAMAAGTWENER